ncbi:MAG: DUF559 domain-containing protein [Bifidobacterium sp.]|nr:DUF559 domain-containing protein [Bifidobacterium sp.]
MIDIFGAYDPDENRTPTHVPPLGSPSPPEWHSDQGARDSGRPAATDHGTQHGKRTGKTSEPPYGRLARAAAGVETAARCAKAQEAHPRMAFPPFCMTTSLLLLGIDLPRIDFGAHPKLRTDHLQLAYANHAGARRPRKSDGIPLETFEPHIPLDLVTVADGLKCVGPIPTWVMFAPYLSFQELVVLGDAILCREPLHQPVHPAQFEAYVASLGKPKPHHRPPNGIVACRKALPFLRVRTDSPQETRTRLSIMRHGLPCPEVNYEIVTKSGHRVILDMAFPEAQVAVEYDGVHHRDQWDDDRARLGWIEESGWIVVRVEQRHLATEDAEQDLADRLARHLRERAGQPYRTFPPVTTEQLADHRFVLPRPVTAAAS